MRLNHAACFATCIDWSNPSWPMCLFLLYRSVITWAWRRLKSLAFRLFIREQVPTNNTSSSNARLTRTSYAESCSISWRHSGQRPYLRGLCQYARNEVHSATQTGCMQLKTKIKTIYSLRVERKWNFDLLGLHQNISTNIPPLNYVCFYREYWGTVHFRTNWSACSPSCCSDLHFNVFLLCLITTYAFNGKYSEDFVVSMKLNDILDIVITMTSIQSSATIIFNPGIHE